ncbi:MAG: DEAD/DEAH box helicase [Sulfurihydrogenibium sp.]|jgi:superfamily II RNA helicase|nr:DEAD/DEAH box helicase [Sulfurihydrogenibium sp.]
MAIKKNIYGKKITPFDWQEKAKEYKNLLIIAPTGSGKTIAAYNWAFSSDKTERIIFTAPIKALSNERFLELKKAKKDVGILTGDVKINENAKILCMTQEIYTNHFAHLPNQKVVIDEVHYMFQDPYRARAYAEGLYKTSKDSDILLLSATITKKAIKYFEKITQRKLDIIKIKEKPVETKYIGKIPPEKLTEYQPAIIFLFSLKGVTSIAKNLANYNEKINNLPSEKQLQKILKLAEKYKINSIELIELAKRNVGIYHGNMRYKEKIFTEILFRKNLIKFIVGTDALSLGVNFPAKTVIFGQLAKYYDGPISKREFLQMSGRAGRLGLWDIGYVGFINTPYESFEYSTEILYNMLLKRSLEPEEIIVAPSYKLIIRQLSLKDLIENTEKVKEVIKEEVESISKLSSKEMSKKDEEELQKDIENEIKKLTKTIMHKNNIEDAEKIYKIFQDIYFDEFDPYTNLYIAEKIYKNNYQVKCIEIYDYFTEKDTQREKLQFLKFFKGLTRSEKYRVIGLNEFEELIKEEDEFVLDPEKIKT